ncbi:MAG: 50S ribosomal protein L18 [Candidatus Aminicenantes bacterium]|nr:50S ribosomal protein L18 [Candidatus Aminicenantes bacterium]
MRSERDDRLRQRIRRKVRGTADRPRVFVFKSNRYIYTQAVNDDTGSVIASASTLEKDLRAEIRNTKNLAGCEKLGEVLARRLKDRKIEKIVFDRGVYPYHGRVKAVAEAMRKGGLVF